MRAEFLFVLALALFASATPAPEAEANAAAAADAEAHAIAEADDSGLISKRDGPLAKRTCVTNGCQCKAGTRPGVYCYKCDAVTEEGDHNSFPGNVNGWVFQCRRDGGCCTYGPRGSCAGGRANPCGA